MLIGLILIVLSLSISSLIPKALKLHYLIVIGVRILIAILNTIIGLPGGINDSPGHYTKAVAIDSYIEKLIDGDIGLIESILRGTRSHELIHGLLQKLTYQPSYFASHCLSILISSLTILILINLYLLFSNPSKLGGQILVLIYGLAPSIATNQTYVLRECFQSFVILFIIYIPIKSFKGNKIKLYEKIIYILSIILGISLHYIFLLFVPIIFLSTYGYQNKLLSIYQFKKILNLKLSPRILYLLLTILLTFSLVYFVIEYSVINYILEQVPLETAAEFLEGSESDGMQAAATYGNYVTPDNPFSIVMQFLAYIVAPLGFSYRITDLIIYPERLFTLFTLFIYLRNRNLALYFEKKSIDLMILIWFFINFAYSLGTTNWGTASRHQVVSFALILLPFIYLKFNKKISKSSKIEY